MTKAICIVDGCEVPAVGQSLCMRHYQRQRRGVPLHRREGQVPWTPQPHAPLNVRFWRRVEKTETCWLWRGATKPNGYGSIQSGGRGSASISTHRLSFEIHNGRVPKGKWVLHRCDVRNCVNPAHLFVGTAKDNTQDMIAKGRHARQAPRGERHRKAILTADQVLAIRASSTRNIDIAAEYGVSPQNIYCIRSRRSWRHI